ncbi:MAG TPA: GTP cyclohydrolase I FolE2 [Gammaproteobacteria bacterium]|nr:GTP cyclohydrolase I FolE2 [Gammaproteobacteria bacterium]
MLEANDAAPTSAEIADVQGSPDTRNITIDKVGVKDLRHPVRIQDRNGLEQNTVATFSMYVELPHNFKGTHMSRFVEILSRHEREISVRSFRSILQETRDHLDAGTSHIEMSFPFFLEKAAPVTGVKSLMDYQVTFIGEVTEDTASTEVRVVVPVTSLCPCSKKISDYGAHNQRSHVTVSVGAKAFIWIEEVIDIVEQEASCELYGLLKRPDEKYVTERAYENPKFVEDMVRDVAGRLNQDDRIERYVVEAENFESIHNHSAYAQITFNRDS